MPFTILINGEELYDEARERFVKAEETEVEFEHSLLSISKWEAKYQKPFFKKDEKTTEEVFYYLRCMLLTKKVDPDIVYRLNEENLKQITEYINAPMTATWFSEPVQNKKRTQEVITAEIIYYWMASLQIDLEWENRHINQLLTLIRVINEKNGPEKKMSYKEMLQRNKALNAQRRAKHHSRG